MFAPYWLQDFCRLPLLFRLSGAFEPLPNKQIHDRTLRALETPDLFALLTTDPINNPPEAVRREIASGTNVAIFRQILLKNHPPESFLKKMGLGCMSHRKRMTRRETFSVAMGLICALPMSSLPGMGQSFLLQRRKTQVRSRHCRTTGV